MQSVARRLVLVHALAIVWVLADIASDAEPPARARLDLRGDVARPGGDLRYVIVNEGGAPLMFGAPHPYGFEGMTADGWERISQAIPVRRRPAAILQGLSAVRRGERPALRHVSPGASADEMCAHVPEDFGVGRYRLTVRVVVSTARGVPALGADGKMATLLISREFTVTTSKTAG